MLKIQEFISCFDSVEEACVYLKRNLNIDSSIEYDSWANKVFMLKPGRWADMKNPLVREAHCLALYPDGDLMAKSWDHPYIVDKPIDLPIDFNLSGAICEEVPDGKEVVVYNIDGEWNMGTKELIYDDISICFSDLRDLKNMLISRFVRWTKPFDNVNPFLCFVFNYINPRINTVARYIIPELYLTGIVNLETGAEMSVDLVETMANRMEIRRPPRSEINGHTSLANRLFNMRALAPGLMLRDKNDCRVFMPNPIHKAVKNTKEAGKRVRPIHIAKILQACRDKADVVTITSAYDSLRPMLELLYSVRGELIEELIMLWSVVKSKSNTADFAETVRHHPLNYILFKLKNNVATDLQKEVHGLSTNKLIKLAKDRWQKEFEAAEKQLKFIGGSTDVNKEEASISFSQEGD